MLWQAGSEKGIDLRFLRWKSRLPLGFFVKAEHANLKCMLLS